MLLTNHGYGVSSDDVLGQFHVRRVAYHDYTAAGAIYVERHVGRGDPTPFGGWLGSRGVALEIVTVHCPLDIRGRIRVLRGAGDHHLFVGLRFCWPGDRHSGWRDWGKIIVIRLISELKFILSTCESCGNDVKLKNDY